MPSKHDQQSSPQEQFVADGAQRLATGVRATVLGGIEADVIDAYTRQLATAGFFRRIWLRRRMRLEIERRVEAEMVKQMPSDGTLY